MKFYAVAVILTLLAVSGRIASAQMLTRIAEVTSLDADDAVKNSRMVKLHGVVTFVDPAQTFVTIDDGDRGVGVSLGKEIKGPALGDEIEVEGRTIQCIIAGVKHPRVLATSLRVLGHDKLPSPQKLTLPELNSFKHFEKLVSVEGHVLRWKYRTSTKTLTVVIAGQTTWTTVVLPSIDKPPFADRLMGAQLRLTGINAGINTHDATGALLVPSLAHVELLKPGWQSTFDAPLVSMTDVKTGKIPRESRVMVRGIVVGFRRNSFQVYLRGADGAQINTLQMGWPRPGVPDEELMDAGVWPALKPGDEVEMVGSTGIHSGYSLHYGDVRVIGHGVPAPPQPVEIKTLQAYQNTDDWVSVEGSVVAWMLQAGSMNYVIDDPRGSLFLIVPDTTEFRRDLYGARVRFTGITLRRERGTDFYTPGPEFVEVLHPGKEDRFDLPERSAIDIATDKVPLGEPVKVKGVVIGHVDRTVYLRCEGRALCVKLLPPWGRAAGASTAFIADGAPHPVLKVEDEVEVVGTAIRAPNQMNFAPYDLVNANVRVVGHQEKVDPVTTTFERVLNGEHTADLVQVRGRFLTWQTMPLQGGLWRNTLLLKADGRKLTAVHQSTLANPFDTLKPDDDVLIQAVVDRATPESPLQLRVLAPGDAKSLGYSSDLLTQRFWFWTLCGVTLVLILSGWIVGLRRSNRVKSKAAEELRAASEAARASEQRWKLLFEQSPLSVQIFSPDGQTKRFNEAWQKLFRLSEEQGYAFNVLKDPDLNASGAVHAIRKAFEGEVVHVPPVPYPVPGDPPETRWIGGVLYPVKNESGEVIEVVTIHNDITKMKHAEDAMQALNQTLEQRVQKRTAELEVARADLSKALDQERELNDLKSRFVSMVSHEFRTPLGVTMSAVEIMRHFDDKLPPEKRRELCDEIHGATRNMAGLMEQVLVLGRVEAGKLGFRPAPMDIESLVGRLVDESLSATNRKCPIRLQRDGNLDGAQGDEALVRHILSNLINNAVKYSPEMVDVSVRLSRDGSDVVFEVQDHGIGIPEKDRVHLYEAFHRCTNVGDIPGTGLGLVIVKRCVDLHGGSIDLQSEVGKGTTFIVRLPMFNLSPSTSHSQ